MTHPSAFTTSRFWIKQLWISAFLCSLGSAAQAQFDYGYNGTLDFSYGQFEPSGALRERRFNSNSMSASFVGGNAKYDLGDGWVPGVTLETFLRLQDLKTGRRDSDPLLSRNAFVSLASPYGALRVGRLQSYLFDTTNRFNAFGNSISFSPALRHVFLSGALEGVQGDFYWNRAISYTSPNLQGATLNLMHAQGPKNLDGNYSAANVVYSRGLLGLTASVQQVRIDDNLNDPTVQPTNELTWQLGATYNLGIARIFGLYTHTQDRGLEVSSNAYSAGFSAPFGPGAVLAQFGYTSAQGSAVDRTHLSTSLAYLYAYNSLVDIYVVGMNDRVRRQTQGMSAAAGVRWRF
jgi:hypothetical protein